jgi:two-component system chemotaxis sensor kinase CheA
MDEIVKDFLIESGENLDRLDQELVKLENDPQSKELLASIFRTIHTIKGSCGFLGFARLEKVAHAGESLLSRLRDGLVPLTEEVSTVLLRMVDAVRHILSEIQASEHEGESDYPELREELKRLQGGDTKPAAGPSANSASGEITLAAPANAPGPTAAAPPNPASPSTQSNAACHPAPGKIGALLVERGIVTPEALATALHEQVLGDGRRLEEILVALGLCRQDDVLSAQQILESRGRETGVETVRVGVNLLDKLMNLVGELVLARNQLLQFSSGAADAGFHNISQRLDLIAGELQEEVMKTRMLPIGNVWNKFPRMVRDLALSCGKEVRLEMEGQDTGLDRTIIEAVKDPLTHLVRNAVDHGIETPEARARAGKPASGCLSLRAFHEGGQVNIEISDDGAGLNLERIRSKALERGLIAPTQTACLSDREVFNLIFLPGFSTAEKVTNVSGRDVGMDVVRTNLEKIGGTVDLRSASGKGTTVRIRIPLTLAIIPALVVRSGSERFAVPQMNLTELVRLESGHGLEVVHGAPVYRLRGQLLPLVYVRDVLNPRAASADAGQPQAIPRHQPASEPAVDFESVSIVVLQAGTRQFGLVVDDILDTEEIVVKPLGKQLKGINVYAGATIMGDGSVALILDVMGLAQRARIVTETHESAHEDKSEEKSAVASHGPEERQALLLAENGPSARVAIPLRIVARLEEFPATVVERSGTQEVMQYRGQIIPLVRLSQILPAGLNPDCGGPAPDSIQVVAYSEGGRIVGLIVDRR